MTTQELFNLIMSNSGDFELVAQAFADFEEKNQLSIKWRSLGDRRNNISTVNAGSDPGKALVERVTNAIDGVLELQHLERGGVGNPRTPREAAFKWLQVPLEGVSQLSIIQRQDLAKHINVNLKGGTVDKKSHIIIRDHGIGITPDRMPKTILGLNEDNKLNKFYLAGAYGQGGSATFAFCDFSIILSKRTGQDQVGFTCIKYVDEPADQFKSGRYAYLAFEENVLSIEDPLNNFASGTMVIHYNFDTTKYNSPLGPNSVYGLLNRFLFDPVITLNLQNDIRGWNRTIRGSRSSLVKSSLQETHDDIDLSHVLHSQRLSYDFDEFGSIKIEYWVLALKESVDPKDPTIIRVTNPIPGIVNHATPILLTLNGQTHDEISKSLIKRKVELPFVADQMVVHIDCNSLSPLGRRELFVSNREGTKKVTLYYKIEDAIVELLKSDSKLKEINQEMQMKNLKDNTVKDKDKIHKDITRLLGLQGYLTSSVNINIEGRGDRKDNGTASGPIGSNGRRSGKNKELNDPPTYVNFVCNKDKIISVFQGSTKSVFIDTDAPGNYFDASNPHDSRIQFFFEDEKSPFKIKAYSPLIYGSMQVFVDALPSTIINTISELSVQVFRPGIAPLTDRCYLKLTEAPPTKSGSSKASVPPFEIIPIEAGDKHWMRFELEENDEETSVISEKNEGILYIYYSRNFFKFKQISKKLKPDPTRSEVFEYKYSVWLAVYTLISEVQIVDNPISSQIDEDALLLLEKQEKLRVATLSCMIAFQEASNQQPVSHDD